MNVNEATDIHTQTFDINKERKGGYAKERG